MSSTVRQLQGMCQLRCCSNSFCTEEKLIKCATFVNVRVHKADSMSKQGLNCSSRIQKPLIISAYRYSGQKQNHQFGGHVSMSLKHTVESSYMPREFEASPLASNQSLPYMSEETKITGASEQVEINEWPGVKVEIHEREWDRVWEMVSGYFLTLDATIKITMLIFIPCYVAVRVIYGIEALKELTPLWILGPLIVAFDIKMFQAISWLSVFSFKQAEKAIRSIPSPTKLAEDAYTYMLQKLVDVKSLEYKNAVKLKLKEFVQLKENISVFFFTRSWPLYWRIIRFLTRAKLVVPKCWLG